MTEQQTYYLTEYALSSGIKTLRGKPWSTDQNRIDLEGCMGAYRLGDNVFKTLSEAIANAEARREKRIASLHKQIAKLEKLTFREWS